LSLRYLLDTNIVSTAFLPSAPKELLTRLERHDDEIALASLVWHELVFGCRLLRPSRRRTSLKKYLWDVILPSCPILEYDRAAAEWHGVERARLVKAGRTPPMVDGQIAAIAAVRDLVLVTDNVADFRGFRDLQLENWLSS
jgi:tRNA(fMet)-specific endonuclease VapC